MNFHKMDTIYAKLAELDVESRAQREFWKAEMVRDEDERLDREVVKMMMEKMTRHLETDMALDSAEFVWSFVRNPVVAMALMAYAGRATNTGLGILAVLLAFISHPATCIMYLAGGRRLVDQTGGLLSTWRNPQHQPLPAEGVPDEAGEPVLQVGLPVRERCPCLWRLLCRQRHQRHLNDIDVEAGEGAERVEE
jgi:hypothetical protein